MAAYEEELDSESRHDAELMLRVSAGDAGAMREIIERHQDSVYATARRMLSDSADAEDIAQRTFIRVWKAASSYEPKAKFTTWLYTILRNLVFNETRRMGRKPTCSSDAMEEEYGQLLHTDPSPSPSEDMEARELEEAVECAIAELPEKARLAVQLRRFQEMSYEEIAAVIGMSVSATKSLLFRARQSLRESLAKYL